MLDSVLTVLTSPPPLSAARTVRVSLESLYMIIAARGEEGGHPAGHDHVRRPEGAGRGQD